MPRHRDSRELVGDATARSLTLLRVFLVASAAILIAGGVVLTSVLDRALRSQAVADRGESLGRYVDGVLRPYLVRGDRIVVTRRTSARLEEDLRREPGLLSVKVWRPDGVLAWTNRSKDRIGKPLGELEELEEIMRERKPHGSIDALDPAGEDAVENALGVQHVLEVYAPVGSENGLRSIGVYEVYADAAPLEASIASRTHVVWLAVGLVFLALYAALALLVRGASRTLRRQTVMLKRRSRELQDSFRALEQSSLEAIESLNATVEAKDPYTAGHSLRVQELSVAIAERLGLSPERIEAVRHAGLFHDIGKLAVPDAILLKPDRLTPLEFEVIKRHSEHGAHIVGKLGCLRGAIPAVLHHHERWDGAGYPDGLRGDEIPLEASIVGLADAWDAMTTERPYARALTLAEALAEVRAGRGHQFAPQVVDAFLAMSFGPALPERLAV